MVIDDTPDLSEARRSFLGGDEEVDPEVVQFGDFDWTETSGNDNSP